MVVMVVVLHQYLQKTRTIISVPVGCHSAQECKLRLMLLAWSCIEASVY